MSEHWRISAACIGWLRYKQRCHLVCWERSPFSNPIYRPDIIGVTRDRKVIEVEIKETFSDFKANGEKRGIKWREQGWLTEVPVRFYFAVPRSLAEKVKDLLPVGAGLLTLADFEIVFGPQVEVIKPATNNKLAHRLSVLQVARMIMHQTGTLHRAVRALSNFETIKCLT